MNDEVEGLVQLRRRMLLCSIVGWPLFMVAEMTKSVMPQGGSHLWSSRAEGVGCALCAVALCMLINALNKLRSNPILARTICDELWLSNRYKAASFAFSVLLPLQGMFVGVFTRWPGFMTTAMYANVNLIVGFVAFFGAFFYLDQKE